MANFRAHKVDVEALAEVGASPLHLPPYSPEFNPIELGWAWSKRKVRAIAPRARKALDEILDGLGATVPTGLCQRHRSPLTRSSSSCSLSAPDASAPMRTPRASSLLP